MLFQPISACARENEHLASLDLADCSESDHSLEVDILVGITGLKSRGEFSEGIVVLLLYILNWDGCYQAQHTLESLTMAL